MGASDALLALAAVLSVALLAAGGVLWLRFARDTRWHELGLALLSGGVIAATVFVAQLGIDASVREAEEARAEDEETRALRVALSSSRSLEGIDLSDRTDLQGIYLGRKRLRYSRLEGADLHGASLVVADLRETDLTMAVLDGAQLRRARLERAFLDGASLRGADLSAADLSGARLRRVTAPRANLQSAIVRGAELVRADLRRADLRKADLTGADARRADLRGADLRGADLDVADLRGAVLTGARLGPLRRLPGRGGEIDDFLESLEPPTVGLDLRGADLRGARVGELRLLADFRGADLRGADLGETTMTCGISYDLVSSCHLLGSDAVIYRRLLLRHASRPASPPVARLAWILINAGYAVPGQVEARAVSVDVDESLLSRRQALRRLSSTGLIVDVLPSLAGLTLRREGGVPVLSSSFEGACIDSETVAPKGVDLTELGASPDYC